MSGGGSYLLSDDALLRLDGTLFERVVPRIDGTSSADDIAAGLAGVASPAEVRYAAALLERRGVLDTANGVSRGRDDVLWATLGIREPDPVRNPGAPPVALRAVGGVTAEPLRAVLARAGVREGDDGLHVVLAADLLCDELATCNADALERGTPWLLVRPEGRLVSVGPLFVPGRTGCWACLAARAREHREPELLAGPYAAGDDTPPRPATDATRRIALGMAAAKIAEWVARGGDLPDLEGAIVSFDVVRFETARHVLARLPACAACGTAPRLDPAPEPWVLRSVAKTHGDRSAPPEATFDAHARHVSELTGIVSSLRRFDAGDAGSFYVAAYGKSTANPAPHDMRRRLRNRAAGRGTTDAQARTGALCEALERHCAYFQGIEPRRRGRLGDTFTDPRDVMLFSARQLRERDRWNARPSRYNGVPLPFDPSAEIEWSAVWSLTRGEPRWVPAALLYLGYPGEERIATDSSGVASGATREEAIVHGFLELVERDAFAVWWYNRLSRPRLDLDALDEPHVNRVRAHLEKRMRDLWVLDLTCDTEIPVAGAFSRSLRGGAERIAMGFGAHFDPRVAALRAVTELAQMLLWVDPPAGTAMELTDPETVAWLRDATMESQPYLAPCGTRSAAEHRYARRDDVRDDVAWCAALAERLGLEVLAGDLTRPEVGLPVVRVIVPGLRSCLARFAPGRLYDVPVRMGWLPVPRGEHELNPVAAFL